jgi:dTDP-4-dehydrorhamnose reductase
VPQPRQVVVVGASGQLASDLIPVLESTGCQVIGLNHSQIHVEKLASVRSALEAVSPNFVINTAAYHRVDDAETCARQAFAVNSIGPRNLAEICREMDVPLMHFSTDYVFSGSKNAPYIESDPVDPLNIYGLSKAAGEMAVRYTWPKHFIVRTTGLYGVVGSSGKGGNFVETMLRLAREGRQIKVVNDQESTPTSTRALSQQLPSLLSTEEFGTYHITCQGRSTWHEFAVAIFEIAGLRPDLQTQSTSEVGGTARRPSNSVLNNAKLKAFGIDQMPAWQESLRTYIDERAQQREVK